MTVDEMVGLLNYKGQKQTISFITRYLKKRI